MKSDSEHWDRIFHETEDEQLGWYEGDRFPTLDLLEKIPGWESASIFIPGVGTSLLVEHLLDAGARLVLNDLSVSAIEQLKVRLGERADSVEWVCQDIAHPLGRSVCGVDIWIDRAVLHFLTDEHDIEGYFRNVKSQLKSGGHALFAEYPPDGVAQCAGLELHRYSVDELAERLGNGFALIHSFDHTYINPDGDSRPYIYALFRRIA
jgi:SAM-dependent methyltransferase